MLAHIEYDIVDTGATFRHSQETTYIFGIFHNNYLCVPVLKRHLKLESILSTFRNLPDTRPPHDDGYRYHPSLLFAPP